MIKKTAMILAAGRGERLRPLTDRSPKPMCLVNNAPLIEHHVSNLAKAGFSRIVINHAHLGGTIRQHLGSGSRWGVELCYSPEPPGGLETGGGLFNALPVLGESPFLAVNGDIFTDFDFRQVNLESLECLHLVLVKKDPELGHHGDFGLDGRVLKASPPDYIFSGIAGYNPNLFTGYNPGRYSVLPLIRQYTAEGKVTAQVHQGVWYDVGTLGRLAALTRLINKK
jgi:MurNAc alpha-1-phosphate uridylyltransferase